MNRDQNDFDKACRFAARLDPIALIAWLLRLTINDFHFGGWLDTRSIPFPGEPDRTCDTVARLDLPGNGSPPWAVPIEFQSEPDPMMFGRLLGYLAQIWQQLKPDRERGSRFQVGAIVVNLTGQGHASRDMRWPEANLATQLAVVERNLSHEPAEALLSDIESGRRSRTLLPWLPLMTGAEDSGMIDTWKRAAEAEPDDRRRSEYGGLAKVFAEAAGRNDPWAEALKGWNVKRSTVADEWRAEGRLEDRQEMLLVFLNDRFGCLPPEIVKMVQQCADMEQLRRWVSAAAKAVSLEEFRTTAGI